jgi:hypothetical protein
MTIPLIRFPVTCPICGSIVVTVFNAAEVADALLKSTPIRLYASCHDIPWDASISEVQQIREYVYQAALESERSKTIIPDTKKWG